GVVVALVVVAQEPPIATPSAGVAVHSSDVVERLRLDVLLGQAAHQRLPVSLSVCRSQRTLRPWGGSSVSRSQPRAPHWYSRCRNPPSPIRRPSFDPWRTPGSAGVHGGPRRCWRACRRARAGSASGSTGRSVGR